MTRHNPELPYDVHSTIDAVAESMARQIEHALAENAREIDRRLDTNRFQEIYDMLCFKVKKRIASREYQEDLQESDDKIYILYPERRYVSAETILQWARDAFADNEIDHEPEDLEDAIDMLDGAGLVTFGKRKRK